MFGKFINIYSNYLNNSDKLSRVIFYGGQKDQSNVIDKKIYII